MNGPLSKDARIKLDSESYSKLHRQVLERDRWRCQFCGSMRHLQVHHSSSEATRAATQKRI